MPSKADDGRIHHLVQKINGLPAGPKREMACTELANLLKPEIGTRLRYFMGEGGHLNWEDVLWDAMYRILSAIPTYDSSKGTFRNFARRIARNAAIEVFRKQKIITVEMDSVSEWVLLDDGFEQNSLLRLELENIQARIDEWLNDKPHYAEIFAWYLQGFKPKEIAEIIGYLNVKQVQDILVKIKQTARAFPSGSSP